MKINGLVCCVDNGHYADLLDKALPLWLHHCDSITVATDMDDQKTGDVCARHRAILHRTNIFYEGGRVFGKSAALEEARTKSMDYTDWIMLFDADVLPPDDWYEQAVDSIPTVGFLYGCKRQMDNGDIVAPQGEIAGYWMMWHVNDPLVQRTPLFDPAWTHAGNFDSDFSMRWPSHRRVILPMVVRHFGEAGKHWCGKGNDEAMIAMRLARQKGHHWREERI